MICEKYMKLTPMERAHYMGELVHSVMNDDALFQSGLALIDLARRKGLFENVTLMPTGELSRHEQTKLEDLT